MEAAFYYMQQSWDIIIYNCYKAAVKFTVFIISCGNMVMVALGFQTEPEEQHKGQQRQPWPLISVRSFQSHLGQQPWLSQRCGLNKCRY